MVLLGVSRFAVWSSLVTSRLGHRAIESSLLSDHYASAAVAVAAEESHERKYRLEPGPDVRRLHSDAAAALTAARLALLGELRRGIERGELFLHYQPKVSLSTGEVVGVEALVRWQHPQRGLVRPDDFIPLAEHTGLIGPLTLFVLDAALAQVRAWADAGHRIPVAVNISARNLADPHFAEQVTDRPTRHGIPAALLVLEVTESAIMLEPERAHRALHQLHAMGIRIAIDDFGAGYTSLAQLKHLPVSELKVGKSFIMTMQSDGDNAIIVRSVVELGHNLGLRVVAEGIETADTQSTLTRYHCDVAQGYHLCRPVPAEAFFAWYGERLAKHRIAKPLPASRPSPRPRFGESAAIPQGA